jgi:hypothetical protein
MAQDLALIFYGDIDAIAGVDTDGFICTGDDQRICDVDWFTWGDIYAADRIGTFEFSWDFSANL